MPPKGRKTQKSLPEKPPHQVGLNARKVILEKYLEIIDKHEEDTFKFLEEILIECKKEFATKQITLLPKTPSAKNRKRRVVRPPSIEEEGTEQEPPAKRRNTIEADKDDVIEKTPSPKIKTRSSKTAGSSNTQRATRNTRAKKQLQNVEERKSEEIKAPVLRLTKDKNISQGVCTPVKQVSMKHGSHIYSPHVAKASPGHVKSKVSAYEEYISPVLQSTANTLNKTNIPETPENETAVKTPDTVIQQSRIMSPKAVRQTPNYTPTMTRRSIRKSLRRSLKVSLSNQKKTSHAHELKLRTDISVSSELLPINQEPTKNSTAKKSRLKLKKKTNTDESVSENQVKNTTRSDVKSTERDALSNSFDDKMDTDNIDDSVKSDVVKNHTEQASISSSAEDSDHVNPSNVKDSTEVNTEHQSVSDRLDASDEEMNNSNDEIILIEEENLERSEPAEEAKSSVVVSSKEHTSNISNSQIGQSDEVNSADQVSIQQNQIPSEAVKKDSGISDVVHSASSQSSSDHESVEKPHASSSKNSCDSGRDSVEMKLRTSIDESCNETRTRTRSARTNSSRSSAETSMQPVRQSARTRPRAMKTSSTNSEPDNDKKLEEASTSRTTRTKTRKAKETPSVGSDSSEAEDPFVVPSVPPTRPTRTKTRKRQMDEDSDAEMDTSLSKRSRTESQSSKVLEVSVESSNTSATVSKETVSDITTESEEDSPECPPHKIVRPVPSFLHNLSNKITPSGKLNTSGITSFIHRNTPPPKLTIKQIQANRKKELEEKQRKELERLQQRDAMMKKRIEEQRKKREERQLQAAKAREQRLKAELELKNKLAKKMEVRSKQIDDQKEEKMREEQEKQKLRLKKLQEAEERRKQEDEERIRKFKEQEEEEQRIKEMKQRQREFEESERLKRLAEERRQKEERQMELERERRAEMERMKALEEKKEKERLQQKVEREKLLAKERIERERLELEKKKQKELEYNQKLQRLKELEKRRLMEEEKRRQDMKEREAAIRNIVTNHNVPVSSAAACGSSNYGTLPKPNLNSTQTVESTTNANSYDMTPVKKYKTPSVDNYDISDLRSDQSTDEDDAPKKKIPTWALGGNLKVALINQYYNPPDLDKLFEKIVPPNLNEIFIKKKARFNKRTSSAQWDSPILKPGPMPEYC